MANRPERRRGTNRQILLGADDPAIKTFMVRADETLVVGTEQVQGPGGTDILRLSRPGEYALVPTVEILSQDQITQETKPVYGIEEIEATWDRPDYSDELDTADLQVVGDSASVNPGEKSSLSLLKDEKVMEQTSKPGVYGLMRIPFERD